ncbi:histidine phosphatase superfamily [Scleroderma yunnanense]
MSLLQLYIVRHGETAWNRERRIQGQLDVPLNEVGVAQVASVAQALKDVHFVKAFTSDLQRASKTAEAILRYHPSIQLVKDEALRERHMGELEGELAKSAKSAPSKETTEALVKRCHTWYTRSIVAYISSRIREGIPAQGPRGPECILVVSHGALISTLLRMLVGGKMILCTRDVVIGHCVNTGVSVIDYSIRREGKDGRPNLMGTLVQFSNTTHLVRMRSLEDNVDESVQ